MTGSDTSPNAPSEPGSSPASPPRDAPLTATGASVSPGASSGAGGGFGARVAQWFAEPAGKAAAVLIAGAAAVMALVTAGWQPLLRADRHIAVQLHQLALEHDGLTRANRILTDWFWDPWTMRALLLVAVILLCARGQRYLGLWVAGTSALEWGGRTALRFALGRERPVWEHPVDSASLHALPSGHAMTAAASGVLLLWLARRSQVARVWWVLAVVVAAVSVIGVCFTRMFLGVHWPTDTLAGALLGTGVACASIATWTIVTRHGPGPSDRTAAPGR